MRNYELAYIADPDLDEQSLSGLQEKIAGWIEAEGGKVLKVNRWGRRRLAYQINKKQDGFYTFIKVELPPTAGQTLEQNLRINEDIMRFMLILEEPAEEIPADEKPAEVKPAEVKPAEEKTAEEEPAEDKTAEEMPAEEEPEAE
ncbi:MAG: 30S ribosomal protein S6 [Anaerolineales bacterium]|nr:30S ribosomal protein S6 [Anaerolineales bacterium]